MKRKICLVEDDRDLREALCLMLQYTENYEVIAAFENAEEALKGIPLLSTDAILMDINLPGENGIECVRKLKWQFPKLLFMMCTSFEEDEVIFESLKAGASRITSAARSKNQCD